MKKILLGSTALVGASLLGAAPVAAAEAPTISFAGWTRVEVSFVDQDLSAGAGRGYHFETDDNYLTWSARGTADNGMTYTASSSMEFRAAGTAGVDEAKISLTNPWGTVVMGDDDGADDSMMVGGFSLMTAGFGYDGGYTATVNRGGVGFTGVFASLVGDTGDATKVSYFTPRWNGLQLGVSWTPDSGHAFDAGIIAEADNDGDNENVLGLGMNYNNTIGDVGVRFGLTHGRANDDVAQAGAAAAAQPREDIRTWSMGGTLSYAGFSVGLGHGDNGDSQCTVANTACDQSDWWDISAQYRSGNTTIAIGRLDNESNVAGSAVGDDVTVTTLGVSHNFESAPGMRAWAEIVQLEVDRTGTASDNDATYMMIGTQIAF